MKNKIRKDIITKRNELTESDIANKSQMICSRIIGMKEYKAAEVLLMYMHFGSEVRLDSLLSNAENDNKRVYIPKIVTPDSPSDASAQKEMLFYRYDGHFTKGSFGILEPECTSDDALYKASDSANTLMIMPGVAFDEARNRMGYGGGYYDRFVEKVKDYPVTFIAVGFECQIVDVVPTEPHDMKPKKIVTENRIIV